MNQPRIYSLEINFKDRSYTAMAIIPPLLSRSGFLEVSSRGVDRVE
jgi:hypothetical protein